MEKKIIFLLVNADALILMTLRGDHHVGFVKNEDGNFLYVKDSKF